MKSSWTGVSEPLLYLPLHNSGALPPVHELSKWPSYIFMSRCLVKHRYNFTLLCFYNCNSRNLRFEQIYSRKCKYFVP